MAEAVYVYGVAPAADAGRLPRGTGAIDPRHPLELVEEGSLVAVASEVDASAFDAVLGGREDFSVLERMVRAHEQVLARAGQAEALLPFRFGTVVAGREALHSLLRARAAELERHLDSLRGADEWGVKVLLSPERLEQSISAAEPRVGALREEAAAGTGRAFFARKRLERELSDRMWDTAAALAGTAHARLAACARRAVANPPQPREVSGYVGEMILNGAYLVDRDREEELRRTVSELEAELGDAVLLELTGPWPAFNFVETALEPER